VRLSEDNSGDLIISFHVSLEISDEFPSAIFCVASSGSAFSEIDEGLVLETCGGIDIELLVSIPMGAGIERSFQFHDGGGVALGSGIILKVALMVFVSGKNARRNLGLDSCPRKIPASARVWGNLSFFE
jgi:hypothetical protein